MLDSTCPLCQKKNNCKVKEERERCWCCNKHIPEALLELVPQALKNKSCICQDCIEDFNAK